VEYFNDSGISLSIDQNTGKLEYSCGADCDERRVADQKHLGPESISNENIKKRIRNLRQDSRDNGLLHLEGELLCFADQEVRQADRMVMSSPMFQARPNPNQVRDAIQGRDLTSLLPWCIQEITLK